MGRPPAELPQGILTFLLTDIEGSTPLWERHGAAMGAALARHQELIAATVAARGGRVIKTQGEGDSTLSVFTRASDAVAAALAMQLALDRERWPEPITLPTRAALHTGEAELRNQDYFGQALNRAARLRALGQGGQVLLSRATAELVADQLPHGASLVDVGSHALKGLSRPEHVFAVVHPDLAAPLPTLTMRAEHPDQVAFVGRRAERAELRAALDGALGGQGQLVLIGGEAGIGKTRLAEEICAEARAREARVAWGRCREGAGAPAYWPWRQALRAYGAGRPPAEVAAELGPDVGELGQLLPELAELEGSRRPAAWWSSSTTSTGPTGPACCCSGSWPVSWPTRGCCSSAPTETSRWTGATPSAAPWPSCSGRRPPPTSLSPAWNEARSAGSSPA
jgi:class 3 adenylate cyclase